MNVTIKMLERAGMDKVFLDQFRKRFLENRADAIALLCWLNYMETGHGKLWLRDILTLASLRVVRIITIPDMIDESVLTGALARIRARLLLNKNLIRWIMLEWRMRIIQTSHCWRRKTTDDDEH